MIVFKLHGPRASAGPGPDSEGACWGETQTGVMIGLGIRVAGRASPDAPASDSDGMASTRLPVAHLGPARETPSRGATTPTAAGGVDFLTRGFDRG